MKNKLIANGKPIKTVSDLMKATVKEDATMINGGYDLFFQELKKYIITKGDNLMLWEDYYNSPHPSISKTEDTDFKVI